MTLGINDTLHNQHSAYATLSMSYTQHSNTRDYDESGVLFIVILNVIMLSVVLLIVVIIMLNFVMLSVIMLSVIDAIPFLAWSGLYY